MSQNYLSHAGRSHTPVVKGTGSESSLDTRPSAYLEQEPLLFCFTVSLPSPWLRALTSFLSAFCLEKESPSTSNTPSTFSTSSFWFPFNQGVCYSCCSRAHHHQVLATESLLSHYRIGSSSVVGSISQTKRLTH